MEDGKMPYLTRTQAAEWLGRSLGTIDNIIREIEQVNAKSHRYGKYATLHSGGVTLINKYVLVDFLRYRKAFKGKAVNLPEFEIMEVRRICG